MRIFPARWVLQYLFTAMMIAPQLVEAQDRGQARSMVISRNGIVATESPLASQAGAHILERGGNAVDAAIAANAVLGLVEPMMDGIGGDLFVLYWDSKAGKLTGLNASGPAPRGLTPEFLASKGFEKMPGKGIHSVTVPGAVDGWAKMHRRYGKLPWKDLFAAAIAYAERGFPVTEMIHEAWAVPEWIKVAQSHAESARILLPGGEPPQVGQIFRNPELAHALRLLGRMGRKRSTRARSQPRSSRLPKAWAEP